MLVGRGDECGRIDRLLAEAELGRSGVLVLHGQPGIGKSALLDYAFEHGSAMDALQVCGVESEADLPYAGLHALLRPVLGQIDSIPSTQARALKTALALEEGGEADRLAAYAGTLSLLAEAAEPSPLLVCIDDAHWLDRSTLEALVFAARRLAGESVAFLLATRDLEWVLALVEGLPGLELHGIDRDASLELLRERWGASLTADVAERIAAGADGNPLALLDIPALLSERERAGLDPLRDPLPVSTRIERSVQGALATMSADAKASLLLAAAGDGRLGVTTGGLEPAVEAGIVSVRDGAVTFRHPLVRAALYHAATDDERRAAHLALAGLLTGESEADRRAWHRAAAAGRPDESVAEALEDAAERARSRGGYASQARALERAAELSPDDESRGRRLNEAAVAAYWSGEAVTAIHLAEQALPLATEPQLHADVLHRLAVIADWHGKWKDKIVADDVLFDEAARLEESDPRRAAGLLGVVLQRRFQALATRDGLELARRRLELCEPLGGDRHFRAIQDLARAHALHGDVDDAAAAIDEVLSLHGAGTPLAFATNVAEPLVWLERYEEARALLLGSIEEARAEGNIVRLMFELTNLALLELRTGRFSQALTAASEAAELAQHSGNDYFHACNLATLARLDAVRGRADECRARADRASTLAEQLGDELVRSEARMALAHLALAAGDPREAIALLEPIAYLAEENEVGEPSVLPFAPDLIEARIRSGDPASAEADLDRLEERARATSRGWALAAVERYRGILAPAEEFDERFGRALELHDSGPGSPLELARTRLCYGERLRRERRRVDAREQLRGAIEIFDAEQAEPWSERARTELRATGESIPRRDPTAPEKLTPQELQISLLVAEGKTNRDVGAALFLSPKTVEYHLTHVYRKLDLHSRAELIRLFSGESAPDLAAPVA
jgi:DNA-binding CsgD family transcriptional regulator